MIENDNKIESENSNKNSLKKWIFTCESVALALKFSFQVKVFMKDPCFQPSLENFLEGYRSAR